MKAAVREEILYREALAMGLDKDDSIVRRRMAQKVEFLFDDLTDTGQPTDAELQRFLDENSDKFLQPGQTSFTHVYLSLDKHGANAAQDARRLLTELKARRKQPDPAAVGDRFMPGYSFSNQTDLDVARTFGTNFAQALASVEANGWRGPIASGYGLHLVYVKKRTEPCLPAMTEIRASVLHELLAARRLRANHRFFETLRDRYTVIVERPPPRHGGARAQPLP